MVREFLKKLPHPIDRPQSVILQKIISKLSHNSSFFKNQTYENIFTQIILREKVKINHISLPFTGHFNQHLCT